MKKKKTGDLGIVTGEPEQKKARNKLVYGVINAKFYGGNSNKNSLDALKLATNVEDFEEREEIFKEHRPALMKLIRFEIVKYDFRELSNF